MKEGTVIADRFRLIRLLGRGGMGAVWLAHDTSLDAPCAIKFIHSDASAQTRSRFELEARSAAQLRSPNVVQILGHGICEGGVPYIAMEFLDGEDLGARLKRLGRLSPSDTVTILSQVAKALTRANAAGLVHRDLKPANIFLVRDEDQDLAKVLDFGVVKSSLPDHRSPDTETGTLLGTPSYMSPEQARGLKTVDHRSDLWSLAVIVFRCVTGELPFFSPSPGDVLYKICADPIPVPSSVVPDLPPGFDAWWHRAAMRDPSQRFQTAREFIEALTLALELAPSIGVSGGSSGAKLGGWVKPSGNDPGNLTVQIDVVPSTQVIPMPALPIVEPPRTERSTANSTSSFGVPRLKPVPLLPPSSRQGISSHSIADIQERRHRGAGLLLILSGAAFLAGLLGYIFVVRVVLPSIVSNRTTATMPLQPAVAISHTGEVRGPVPDGSVSAAPPAVSSAPISGPAPIVSEIPRDGGTDAGNEVPEPVLDGSISAAPPAASSRPVVAPVHVVRKSLQDGGTDAGNEAPRGSGSSEIVDPWADGSSNGPPHAPDDGR